MRLSRSRPAPRIKVRGLKTHGMTRRRGKWMVCKGWDLSLSLTTICCCFAMDVPVCAASPTRLLGRSVAALTDVTTRVPHLPADLHRVLVAFRKDDICRRITFYFRRGTCQVSGCESDDRQQTNGKHFHLQASLFPSVTSSASADTSRTALQYRIESEIRKVGAPRTPGKDKLTV